MNLRNRLLGISVLFLSNFAFGRNVRIYNPNNQATLEVRFNGKRVTIRPETSTRFTIPDTKIMLDVYSYGKSYPAIAVFRITIEEGRENLEITEKDFESFSEDLKPQEKVTIEPYGT